MEEKISIKQWISLVFICGGLLGAHYLIDKNLNGVVDSILQNLIGTIISMLFTGIFLNYILKRREKRIIEKRINTLLGIFYGEFGNELLYEFTSTDVYVACLVRKAKINCGWTEENYKMLKDNFEKYEYSVIGKKTNIIKIAKIIKESESFILDILFTQVIQNAGELSEILFDVVHLRDELNDLEDINNIREDELTHLEVDMIRLYRRLAINWVGYMKFLSENYPQLFMKALKKSPYEK